MIGYRYSDVLGGLYSSLIVIGIYSCSKPNGKTLNKQDWNHSWANHQFRDALALWGQMSNEKLNKRTCWCSHMCLGHTFRVSWRRIRWRPAVSWKCRRASLQNGPVPQSSAWWNPARGARWRTPPLAGSHRYDLVTVVPQLLLFGRSQDTLVSIFRTAQLGITVWTWTYRIQIDTFVFCNRWYGWTSWSRICTL